MLRNILIFYFISTLTSFNLLGLDQDLDENLGYHVIIFFLAYFIITFFIAII